MASNPAIALLFQSTRLVGRVAELGSLGRFTRMQNIAPANRRGLNQVALRVGLFGILYFVICVFVLATIARRVSIPDVHPVLGGVAVFIGAFVYFLPLWWLSDRLRRRYGLVCETCGAWLSFRRSERGECHRGHHKHSNDAA